MLQEFQSVPFLEKANTAWHSQQWDYQQCNEVAEIKLKGSE